VGVFAQELVDHLKIDKTKTPEKQNNIYSQLKGDGVSFYDYLFGLDYLDVKYKVLFNGKDLNSNEFSPGEKGALLLIFYLLIDKDRGPLIMDQPEENLDNESIFELLVPYIRKAKLKRQVIIVTHNPNLAIVCDAEQIIAAAMNKQKSQIRYEFGSIENRDINKKASDVLEGTLPAFDIRDEKYIRI
jgi:predicted ATPase